MTTIVVLLALLFLPFMASAQLIPTTPSGLPLSVGVPGVIQPPQTDSTTSTVTVSPDVTVTTTLAGDGNSDAVALSGRSGVGFAVSVVSGTPDGTFTPALSFDGGTSYVSSWGFREFSNEGTLVPVRTITMTFGAAFRLAVIAIPGATHARLTRSGSTTGSVSVRATSTMIPGNVVLPFINGLSTTLGGFTFQPPLSSPIRLGGTSFTLRASGSLTPPVVTATQPPHPVMTFTGTIPGVSIGNYVIDSVVIRHLGAGGTPNTLSARVVKRHVMYASTQTAAPAAGAVPTCAALAYTGAANGGGSYTYKYVAVDIWGYEGNLSGASATCSPAANNGETVTLPAVPAGAAGYNVYRTKTGPGATYYFLGRTNTTTFRDITNDTDLVVTSGTIGVWGTTPSVETVNTPMEFVLEKFVALGTAPTIISTKTFPGTNANNRVVTIAPGTAVGRYRIPGEVETKAFLTTPTITTALARDVDTSYTYGQTTQINSAFGDIAVNSFNISNATIAGTFVVWGHELIGVTEATNIFATNAGALQLSGYAEGTTLLMKWVAPPVFSATDEIAIEIGNSLTNGAVTLEVMVTGRYF